MDIAALSDAADLVRSRNAVDARIAALIGRPALSGHLGEWVAAQIFDIELEASAVAKAIDGHFRSGSLAGKTVNIKTYGKREGILDTNDDPILDFYLVLAGPRDTSMTSRDGTRPWCIDGVYLFDARLLRAQQVERGIRSGIASSVCIAQWAQAEIFPNPVCSLLPITAEQRACLAKFGEGDRP